MKQLPVFLLMSLLWCSCKNGNSNENNSGGNNKLVLGAPAAVVSTTPNNERQIKGPLSYAPNVPKLQEGDTVEVKFDVTHKLFHVKSDIAFVGWLFGDSLPGPVLHIRVGQTVKFSMTDRSNEAMPADMAMQPMPHSIDFHAGMVNPADKWRSINPGETISFTWTANYPGVFMYHCGTPMVLLHMISGMIGMVIVDPKDGFPGKVDHEFALVQNEYYLKPNGSIYTPDTTMVMKKQPTFVSFNGKPGQYVVHPIHVKAGERIRLYILNAGPNNASSFHVIGTIFDKVWITGNPKNELEGIDVINLGPATSAIVEFVLPEKGRYSFVDHSFADAEMGATGVFVAD
ncbi:MAG: multicopper oxidase domain-containing protein [Bacteroidota bacterium]|nr:multicopper oxidase domain-containing protein [Bacteroidota bacterium]